MTESWHYDILSDSEDGKRLNEILSQCFLIPLENCASYIELVGQENYRLVRRDNEIAGGLIKIPTGHWLGGKLVETMGVSAVGIAPEYRGTGAASTLLGTLLRELYQEKIPLSSLYPATPPLYRKLGYEQAISRCLWQIPIASLKPQKPQLACVPIENQTEAIAPLYEQFASRHNGAVQRHEFLWHLIWNSFMPLDSPVYTYLFGDRSAPEGYIIFRQKRGFQEGLMEIRDRVLLTPAAIQSFWAFLYSHRSQMTSASWHGPQLDATMLTLPLDTMVPTEQMMLSWRIVHLEAALRQRGYPPLSGELHLEIDDEMLPENCDRFVLTLKDGKSQVTRGGRGELRLNIRHLAPLYSGLWSASQLHHLGYIEGTSEAIALANGLFAGDLPGLSDFF
ncbi:GNAT family N-acetyltransferase [Sodalinema gerasimenkoae]|uniref:GNAT family N-acetyltransferase n=1 Tax=Sodalinema gerasimenkoae TaxID=2862348 RepID=UPI00135A6194|nr:GNAT family N-acetyltransferase [Sodalinema gerasimenkoae]